MTLAPNGSLLVVCNDSGFVFQVSGASQPAPVVGLQLITHGTNGVRLSWAGIFGRGYRVERTFNLTTDLWQPIGAVGGKPAGYTEFIDAEPATRPLCAYRVLPSL